MKVERINNPQTVEERWIRGWAGIRRFVGLGSGAVLNLAQKYGFPLHKLPNGDPIIITSEVNGWLRTFSELSSPFRMRKLSGAAKIVSEGGTTANDVMNQRAHKKRMQKYFVGADFSGTPPGTFPPDGPISPYQ
jgi:hypothetical protein